MDFNDQKCVVCGSEPDGHNGVYPKVIGWVCNRCCKRGEMWAVKMAYSTINTPRNAPNPLGDKNIANEIETALKKAETGDMHK